MIVTPLPFHSAPTPSWLQGGAGQGRDGDGGQVRAGPRASKAQRWAGQRRPHLTILARAALMPSDFMERLGAAVAVCRPCTCGSF